MANATKRAPLTSTPFGYTGQYYGASATPQTFWTNSLVGLNAAGFLDPLDDTQPMAFAGVVGMVSPEVPLGGNPGDVLVNVETPRFLTIPINAPATVADIGKTVYAADTQTCTLSPGLFGNALGRIFSTENNQTVSVEVYYAGASKANILTNTCRVTTSAAAVETLTRHDLNKIVFVGNTAVKTVVLPPIAVTRPGDQVLLVKNSAAAFAVTVAANAAETINAGTTLTLAGVNNAARVVSDGTRWITLSAI